ncbi:MAG: hypothetical protein ACYC64_19475 [Armatimonadota bacterium]
MKTSAKKSESKVRTLRVRRIGKSYVEECRALQDKIREERSGELMPDSAEIIREMREGDLR